MKKPEACGTISGTMVLDPTNIAPEDMRHAQSSYYVGNAVIFVYGRWPPWQMSGVESMYETVSAIAPAKLSGGLPFSVSSIGPGPHWVTAYWRPQCSASADVDMADGDFFPSGRCDGKCQPFEPGKGVPFCDTSLNKHCDGLVIRLNAVRHVSTKPVVSLCRE